MMKWKAETELAWYFASNSAVVGFGAQNVEGGSNMSADEKASRQHERMIEAVLGEEYGRARTVEHAMQFMSAEDYQLLRLAFERPTDESMGGRVIHEDVRKAYRMGTASLFPVALVCSDAVRVFADAHGMDLQSACDAVALAPSTMKTWLKNISGDTRNDDAKKADAARKAIGAVCQAAGMLLSGALGRYEAAREAAQAWQAAREEDDVDRAIECAKARQTLECRRAKIAAAGMDPDEAISWLMFRNG